MNRTVDDFNEDCMTRGEGEMEKQLFFMMLRIEFHHHDCKNF